MGAYLHNADVLRSVRARERPALGVCGVCLGNADGKVFEYATEELEVRQLHRVDPDVFAKLDNDELRFTLWRAAGTEHVPVAL